jgi:Spy/CpxP family protein refolding chaperone
MRKTRVLALVVASLVSTASFAGAQASAPAPQAGRHAMGRGMEGRRGGERGALRGLKLSDAEKSSIKTINTKYAAESKTLGESLKPTMQEARTLRQKGDTAGLRALWAKNKPARDQMQALRVRQDAEIRAALSADNQKLFDANVAKRAEWAKSGKAGKRGANRGRNPAKVG